MKIILATAALLLCSCTTIEAQQPETVDHTLSQMFAKPVHCAPHLDSLIEAWEEEDVYPLVALGGVAWMDTGQTVPSVTFILVNEDGRNAVVEQTESGYCLLSSGNVVEYNSDKIKQMMKWE